jgi:hypothetical protein
MTEPTTLLASRRTRLEIAAVALTIALYVVCYEVLDARGLFIAVAFLGWTVYFVLRCARDPTAPHEYGLGRRGLRPTALAVAAVVAVGAVACVGVGAARGTLQAGRGLGLALALYPLWGLVQQLLVQAIVVRPLAERLPATAVVATAAALFGAIHLPDVALTAATAALGAVFTPIYLRWRNVWPLGVGHGVLGALFYVEVLGRDPWAESIAAL